LLINNYQGAAMKKEFKVGQRVAIYDVDQTGTPNRDTGEVMSIAELGGIQVKGDGWSGYGIYHPKQLSLINKKSKRVVWFSKSQIDAYLDGDWSGKPPSPNKMPMHTDSVQYKQVRKK